MKSPPVRLLCAERLRQEVAQASRVLDVGSGGRRLGTHVVTTDIVPRSNVDVVADGCSLPFEDGAFDLVVCTSVLEHVCDERTAIAEIRRVTAGRVWIEVPFLYHYHVSTTGDTADYRRWTWEGVVRLLDGFRILDHGHNVGPGTALRLLAAEVLAMPFYSERHTGAYYLARWGLSWLFYPIGILDMHCARKLVANRATGGFWVLAERAD